MRLRELDLPEESIIVSISRDDQMIIPRGNTQLMGGDRIIIVCHNRALHQLSQQLHL